MIVSETEERGRAVAERCNSQWSNELRFPTSTDIIIVAVPDHKLKDVLASVSCRTETLIAHTAGSYGREVFPDYFSHTGVFYPLQTFSINRKVDFQALPILIESSDNQSSDILKSLAESIHGKPFFVNIEQRRMLHVAAVFVNNFVNHMLTQGKEITKKTGLPYDILTPLITETIAKALESGPEFSQTGPAIRNDQNTIEKHLKLLSYSPELQRIYKEISDSILEYYKK
jgi:predicted short-subunit dehydrogenase-like oxidoreductase (DUF2520 family)